MDIKKHRLQVNGNFSESRGFILIVSNQVKGLDSNQLNLEKSINTMAHRNLVRDALYGILHHCEQQRNGRYDQRHPMAQTGQIPDEMATAIFNLGFQLLEAALTTNGINNTQGNQVDNQTDVLSAATTAYQRGHITKAQYFAVINALDEPTVETTAYVQRTGSIIRR